MRYEQCNRQPAELSFYHAFSMIIMCCIVSVLTSTFVCSNVRLFISPHALWRKFSGPSDFFITFAPLLTVDGFVLIATTEKNAKTVSPRSISTIRPCLCLTIKIAV
jgi:hypothetical protein